MLQLLFRALGLVRSKALEEFHILEPRFHSFPKLFLVCFFFNFEKRIMSLNKYEVFLKAILLKY